MRATRALLPCFHAQYAVLGESVALVDELGLSRGRAGQISPGERRPPLIQNLSSSEGDMTAEHEKWR